jgi:D-beta-D-heptose 7-phosphate kinase/D-beta-D-heptose 1-phosphate adenosyltransferase
MREALAAGGIDGSRVLSVHDRPTTTKTRVVARGQQVVRVDEEVEHDLTDESLKQVARLATEALEASDILLLEDYDKGTLAPTMIPVLVDKARSLRIPVVVDPKYRHFYSFAGATVFKPNRGSSRRRSVRQSTRRLPTRTGLPGAGPMPSISWSRWGRTGWRSSGRRKRFTFPATAARCTMSPVPAIRSQRGLASALAAGASMEEAAIMANLAAGIEVGKPGVATVSVEELLAAYDAG